MSYVGISGVKNLNGLMAYLFFGKGKGAAERRRQGNVRTVANYCSTNLKDFLQQGNSLQAVKGLKLSAISIIQSFDNKLDGLDYKSEADQRYVNDLGRELAHRLYPNSLSAVETHNDGKHHELHNHLVILNFDSASGHAISTYLLSHIRQVNNELMKERNLSIIQPKPRDWVVKSYRTKQNEEKHGKEWVKKYDFDTALQQKIDYVLSLKPQTLDEYTSLLNFSGINIREKAYGKDKKLGLSYRMFDPYHVTKNGQKKPRERKIKASSLGVKYTLKGLNIAFNEAQKQPLDLTFAEKSLLIRAKYTTPINPAQKKYLADLKQQANAIIKAHKSTPKQSKAVHQVTTPAVSDKPLKPAENVQIQQQRKLFVEVELEKIKRKLKEKLKQTINNLKQAYKKQANEIDDKKTKRGIKYWDLFVDGSWTETEYSDHMSQLNKKSNADKQKEANRRDLEIKKANESYNHAVQQEKTKLEARSQHEITEIDPDFDQKQKEWHKNHLEKSLADDKKKVKKSKKRKTKKQHKQKKEERDLNKDGLDDWEEMQMQAIDTDIEANDPYINEFTTGFSNKVTDTSAKIDKTPDKPKTQPQKHKKQTINNDHSLQDAWFNQNPTAPTQPTAPNYDNPQY